MTNKEELKTLKDIDNTFYYHSPNKSDAVVRIKDLKTEAIKWVKKYPRGQKKWVDFFNLTEKDLK